MDTLDLPPALIAAQFQWSLSKSGLAFRSPFNGTAQSVEFVADRWTVTVTWPAYLRDKAGVIDALGNQLAGGYNRLRLWHMGSGPRADAGRPYGTLRGAPVTSLPIARGDKAITLRSSTGGTLLVGDMVRINGQMFQVAASTTLYPNTDRLVQMVNRARAPSSPGAAVEWDRPTADFIVPAQRVGGVFVPKFLLGQQWDLEEVW